MVGMAAVGKFTVKLNVLVRVTPPLLADTVIVDVPAGVVPAVVLMVNVDEQVGMQLADENEAVTPKGNPDAENVTGCALPETNVAMIELVTEEPAVTDLLPVLLRKKSNGCATVNEALATPLGLYPLMNALAFTVALFVSVIAPL
jgi:hypothetical protein